MWLINEKRNQIVLMAGVLFLLSCAVQKQLRPKPEGKEAAQRKVVLTIDSLLKARDYTRAEQFGRRFLERYPGSVYADDVAYRMAYLGVIADEQNPFFDYSRARLAFKHFLQKFPASHYALACNNWLKVLYLNSQLEKEKARLQRERKRLEQELKARIEELNRLQSTLNDLENVIKR